MPGKRIIPQYRKLYENLRKQISDGIYKEGDLLPSENELSTLYGVTRSTVRQSLGALANEGFIKKHQGKGSIVHLQLREIGILSVSGTTSAVGNNNLTTSIIVKPVVQNWPDNFMFQLTGDQKNAGCVYMERVRALNGRPIFYDISYLTNINIQRITSRQFENRSLFGILREHYGIEIRGGEQRIKALKASEKTGKYLGIKKDDPVLHLERSMETNIPGLIIYSSIFCNTQQYSIFGRF